MRRTTYAALVLWLCAACATPAPRADLAPALAVSARTAMVIVVRHAEKILGAGDDPDLTEAGFTRADALAHALGRAGVRAVFATEYRRTRHTVGPLAKALGLEVLVRPAKETEALARELRDGHAGEVVVVAAHSNTIPALLAALGVPEKVTIPDSEYDDLFVVRAPSEATGAPAELLVLRYGAPSPGR